MELNFNYTAQLLSFCEILALSAVLSVVVMYIVEMLKKIILTTNSRIFTLLCFVTVSYTHLDVYKRQPNIDKMDKLQLQLKKC